VVDISGWELVTTVWVSLWLTWQTLRICRGTEILSMLLGCFYASRENFLSQKVQTLSQLLHYDYIFLLQMNCKSSFFSNYKPSTINITTNISNIKLWASFTTEIFQLNFIYDVKGIVLSLPLNWMTWQRCLMIAVCFLLAHEGYPTVKPILLTMENNMFCRW